jgi:hypothetical protein
MRKGVHHLHLELVLLLHQLQLVHLRVVLEYQKQLLVVLVLHDLAIQVLGVHLQCMLVQEELAQIIQLAQNLPQLQELLNVCERRGWLALKRANPSNPL